MIHTWLLAGLRTSSTTALRQRDLIDWVSAEAVMTACRSVMTK
ncbi:hypothetical protein ACN28S_54755 [Cystobacter fuscus]